MMLNGGVYMQAMREAPDMNDVPTSAGAQARLGGYLLMAAKKGAMHQRLCLFCVGHESQLCLSECHTARRVQRPEAQQLSADTSAEDTAVEPVGWRPDARCSPLVDARLPSPMFPSIQ